MKKAIAHLQEELEALKKELLDSRMKEDENAESLITDIHAEIAEFEQAIEILTK